MMTNIIKRVALYGAMIFTITIMVVMNTYARKDYEKTMWEIATHEFEDFTKIKKGDLVYEEHGYRGTWYLPEIKEGYIASTDVTVYELDNNSICYSKEHPEGIRRTYKISDTTRYYVYITEEGEIKTTVAGNYAEFIEAMKLES